jgi:hypothetical protein
MNEGLQKFDEVTTLEAMNTDSVKEQVQLIQHVMKAVMKPGIHYGTIPGCGDKPTLLKPGAEKLQMTFKLAPKYEIFEKELARGHREYRVTCIYTHSPTETFLGEGVGVCTTMEGKYRFRAGKEITDRAVPPEYWDARKKHPKEAQELIGGKGFSTVKEDGVWMIAKSGERVEHDNPADYYNTVLKIGKKRAQVDGILTVTAASDIFTQDIEDDPTLFGGSGEVEKPKEEVKEKLPKKISEKQRGELVDMVMEKDWPESSIVSMLAAYGFDKSTEITTDKYKDIMAEIKKGPPEA